MLKSKLQPFLDRYNEISELLCSSETTSDISKMTELSREQKALESIKEKAEEYLKVCDDIDDNKEMLEDKELGDLAKEELKELEPRKIEIEEEIKVLMLPRDPNDDRNIYLEMRAGTGGDEAALFVGDLFKAYVRYAEANGWKVEIMSSSEGTVDGYKEVIALIKGEKVVLNWEKGDNRAFYSFCVIQS